MGARSFSPRLPCLASPIVYQSQSVARRPMPFVSAAMAVRFASCLAFDAAPGLSTRSGHDRLCRPIRPASPEQGEVIGDAVSRSSGPRTIIAVSARSRVPRTPSEAFRASVAFFEHSLDAALFTAPDGRILHANDAASELLGMTKDEICRLGRAGLADPADDRWAAGVAERARTGRFFGPLSFRRGDGTLVELVVSSKVFTDADGEPRTVIVMRPLTSERGLDEALNVAVVDPSGIPNRPAFVQLAEMQRHKAVRENVGLGLIYARLNVPDAIAGTEAASDATRAV